MSYYSVCCLFIVAWCCRIWWSCKMD